jgi:hypothetical protein
VPRIPASRPEASHGTRTIFGHRPTPVVLPALLLATLLAAGCGQMTTRAGISDAHITATPTTVLTPTPTTPPLNAWHTVPGLETGYDATLALAPSDPRIAYRLTLGSCASSCPGQYTLSESADAGAHWSRRTVPSLLPQYQRGARNVVFLNLTLRRG